MEANETTGSLKEIGKSDPLEIGSRIISGIFTPFMVPFLAFSMTSIFSGKDLRTFAVVIVITVTLCQEPAFGTIEMLIHQIHFQIFHFRP